VTWEVRQAHKYSSGRSFPCFRVQRMCGHGAAEVVFSHESEELCSRVANVLNEWEVDRERK
jgi:hypothetical protein